MAFVSAILTVKFTASTSFKSSTDSKFVASANESAKKARRSESDQTPKRKVMYFVSTGFPGVVVDILMFGGHDRLLEVASLS